MLIHLNDKWSSSNARKQLAFLLFLILLLISNKVYAVKYYYGGTYVMNFDQSPVYKSETDRVILRFEIYVYSGFGGNTSFVLNNLLLSTNGSTSVADIAKAKLWYTGTNASFTSPTLLQTINNPAGNMNFNNINITSNGVTFFYYWLTYDVSATATAGNLLDAQVRNNGITYTDGNGSGVDYPSGIDPEGFRIVSCPPISPPATPVLSPGSMFTKPTIGTWMMSTGVSIVRQPNGKIYTAGSDQDGEWGDGVVGSPFMSNNMWIQNNNANLQNIVQVDNGINTNVALKNNGTVWAWGDNWWGKTGSGNYGLGGGISPQPTPQQVVKAASAGGGFLTNVVKVMSGDNQSVALTSNHNVYAWGYNSSQGFGPSYALYSWFPAAVQLTADGVNPINWAIDVDCGDDYITMLRWDGTVWTMGYGMYGQLGDGQGGVGYCSAIPKCALAPGSCNALTNIVSIAAGRRFMLALQSSGNVYGWGLNNYGQTGTGNAGTDVYQPKKVLGPGCSGYLSNIVQISAAGDNGYALDASGNLFSWGSDQNEQLADGPGSMNQQCPKLVATGIAEVQSGLYAVMVRKTTGEICAAGNNWHGNFGLGGPWGCCGYIDVLTCTTLPLPVNLLSFTGENKSDGNYLYWSTTGEIQNDYFEIQRSTDSKSFEKIGTVAGMGNSTQLLNYEFRDAAPLRNTNYYRLRQVDYNGTSAYSNWINVKNNNGALPWNIWEDNDGNYILSCGTEENLTVSLLTTEGKILKKWTMTESSRSAINMQEFLSGCYIVRIEAADMIWHTKVLRK